MFTFVTGGNRSGRSNYGLRRAAELGPPPWLYVATGRDTDEAIRKRIERHRRDAEAIWRTAVIPRRLLDLIEPSAVQPYGAIVIDGLAAWIEARLEEGLDDRPLLDEIVEAAERLYRSPVPLVVTSTELGWAPLPRAPEEQRLIRVVSSANQILAEQAATVVLMVAGLPMRVR